MLNCRDATLLMAKKEEGILSFPKPIKLSIHTYMCSFCRNFELQAFRISKESRHAHSEDKLSSVARERIKKIMENH